MLHDCRTELVCDLAEVYHIYDYRAVPVRTLGTLVSGLGENSRVVRKMTGAKASLEAILLGHLVDGVNYLVWGLFSGKKNEKPASVLDDLITREKETRGMSIEEFEKLRQGIWG